MIVPGSVNPLLLRSAAATGYQVSRSLRFNSSDSAYLSRTPASAGNRKTWTWAGWVKRSGTGNGSLFTTNGSGDSGLFSFEIDSNNLRLAGQATQWLRTSAVFRDFSAWYHIVLATDTTQATAADRFKLYVNGAQITAFAATSYPAQNADLGVNSTVLHHIGSYWNTTPDFNGYLADIHFIDGQALTPSSFTEVSATTGQLIPKAYTGSFGTNGFWLKFSDNSAATATTLGKDYSGNSNNWTPNNLSVTAGAGNDSLVDTPTSYGTDTGAGGEVKGNYATLNPLDKGANVTLTNGNLDVSTASTWNSVRATFGLTSGKWYWEYTMTAAGYTMIGVGTRVIDLAGYIGQSSSGYAFYSLNGNKWNAGTAAAYGNSFTTNDVISVAFDADAGKIWFAKNGSWQASGDPAAGTNAAYSSIPSGTYFPTISQDNSLPAATGGSLNAGARPFAYTAPSGYKALCDTNLPAPVVAKGSSVMNVKLYTGNGGTQSITGLAFSPDLVWIKSRSAATDHKLTDTVRGATKGLISDSTGAETTDTNGLTAFNSDGFSLGTDTNYNNNAATYVGWTWDAGTSTVTNTQGSITSSVRANASAGFSIVGWNYPSGTGASTIGHGLGVKPGMIIIKTRDSASNWIIYHTSVGATKCFRFNTQAASTESDPFNNTEPTSTVFSIGAASWWGAGNMVAYCFAPVTGYSSMGSYVGNGSSDGVFQWCGFRPRWILLKSTGANGASWTMFDTARSTYNQTDAYLFANASSAEGNAFPIDILSNGFKLRTSDGLLNSSSYTYVWAAFAENPFQYARAR